MQVQRLARLVAFLVASSGGACGEAIAQSYPAPPTGDDAAAVRDILTRMKAAERGPYERLRWYCVDGTEHPPQGSPCSGRGGGSQHAEPNAEARRLAALNFHVGTILQGMPYEQFADEARAGDRLRELVLERYLVQVDDGWVMRRARYYRGALQIEDEEASGRLLLEQRFSDPQWLTGNYFLATRLAASIPHPTPGSERTMDRIRATATEIALLDEGFMRMRVKIHSVPTRSDIGAVQAYLAAREHPPEVREKLVQLHEDLVRQYDPQRALASLAAYERRVGPDLAPGLVRLRAALDAGTPERVFTEIVALAPQVRLAAEGAGNGTRALDLIDLGLSLQERAYVLADELDRAAPYRSRAGALERLGQYVRLGYGSGYLSARERDALLLEIGSLSAAGTTTAAEYKHALGYAGRSLDWARGTVRGTFASVLDRYAVVEPAAAGLSDALLRGSVLLPMSRVLDDLQTDADGALGATHSIFGATVSSGIRGLNPGVSRGPLAFLAPGHHDEVNARTIYVLEETPPELKPVAGVLTLAEGNLLSHVQLLARNLGIPNATLAPDQGVLLRPQDGADAFYAVTPLGRVIVKLAKDMNAAERRLVETGEPGRVVRQKLDTSRLRLDVRQPVLLYDLRSEDSGVLVGPKAANLGQLAFDFPGRVSPGVALPFGMFVQHADRPYGGSQRTVLAELKAAYGRTAAMTAQGRPEAEVDAFMLERLAWVRQAIEGLEWDPALREQIVRSTTDMLQGDLSRGVFVRSDTNVEDLPQFSGAGLNLTIAHQTSMEDILASVKRVWTSPFSDRAYLWRRQILDEQGDVFPSVLLQQTVPSEKSGVLITSGLQEGGPEDLTVVAAEGVGGGVDGEDSETLLIGPGGAIRLLSQAKGPRRREVVTGGTRWVAARQPETLLQPGEIAQLRAVVATWQAKKAGTPDADTTWDMEYGFVNGRLWLLQVRPFVRFRNSEVYMQLEAFDAGARANGGRRVNLQAPLGSF